MLLIDIYSLICYSFMGMAEKYKVFVRTHRPSFWQTFRKLGRIHIKKEMCLAERYRSEFMLGQKVQNIGYLYGN